MQTGQRTLAGRYRLQEVIGRGGMSTVYRATDRTLGRTVAVKILLAGLAEQDPTYSARFKREARAAAALANSAVVTVYDTGVDGENQYIVMEYVEGRSLDELLRDGEPLEVSEALRIAGRVADALASAHAAGILHRDIKPGNVMVANDGTVKVLDFGIARRLDGTTITQAASVIGTAAYMAPERALGQPGDARADVYSLGCLLYAMLAGRPPFSGDVSAAVLHQQINAEPRPPSELREGIPPALDALILRMLAKDPDARPADVAEVRDRLSSLVGGAVAGDATEETAALTAPTRPIADPTRPLAAGAAARSGGAQRRSAPRRGLLDDHRRRAILMALATAAITLIALALLSGGGSSHNATTQSHSTRATTPPPTTATTTPTTAAHTQATPPEPPAPKPAKPKPPPPGHAKHPGHGESPPGHDKKH